MTVTPRGKNIACNTKPLLQFSTMLFCDYCKYLRTGTSDRRSEFRKRRCKLQSHPYTVPAL